jgi:hypothetical protein
VQFVDVLFQEDRAGVLQLVQVRMVDEQVGAHFGKLCRGREQRTVVGIASHLFRQQIGNLRSDVSHGPRVHRRISSEAEWAAYAGEFGDYAHSVVCPFLSHYDALYRLVQGTLAQEPRLPRERRFIALMATAASLLQMPDVAVTILDNTFRRTASRKEIAWLRDAIQND